MTEYEIIDAFVSLRMEIAQHSMNFASVLFGYLIAAYFVGSKLTKFQVTVITVLYILWSPAPITAAYDASIALRELYNQNQDVLSIEMGRLLFMFDYPTAAIATAALSWLMSIIFMAQVRASKSAREIESGQDISPILSILIHYNKL